MTETLQNLTGIVLGRIINGNDLKRVIRILSEDTLEAVSEIAAVVIARYDEAN
jgi:hypothetical protein